MQRPLIIKEQPTLAFPEVTKLLGQRWKALSDKEKVDAQREALELGLVRVQGLRELGTRALGGRDVFSMVVAAREAEKQAQAVAVGASEWDLEPATSGAVEVTEDGAGAVEAAVGTMGAVRDRDVVRPPAAAARELTDERIANARVWGKLGTGNG